MIAPESNLRVPNQRPKEDSLRVLALALVIAGVAWGMIPAPALYAAETRLNVVWIVGEDLGPELGCYGDANAVTPNLDRLARQGVRFTRAFTHAPVCAPSRSGLITGRIPRALALTTCGRPCSSLHRCSQSSCERPATRSAGRRGRLMERPTSISRSLPVHLTS